MADDDKEDLVMFSGGLGSWAAAKLRRRTHPGRRMRLLFADTKTEDPDLYRFLPEAAANVGPDVELIRIADGRDIWQVFRDERMLGNSRIDPCSKILKRELMERWRNANCDPARTTLVLGFGPEEGRRVAKHRARVAPWETAYPVFDAGMEGYHVREWLDREGIELPRLYDLNFEHNNCFHGSTRFLTDQGTKTLREMAGQECKVLGSRGDWTPARIQSFGTQSLWRVTLRKRVHRKVLLTTADHRWFVRVGRKGRAEVVTRQLAVAQQLASVWGRTMLPSIVPSAFGIAHGIVFGDGTRNDAQKSGYTNPAVVVLCGEKAELQRFFPLSKAAPVPDVGVRVNNLPRYFKERPSLAESKSYLYGWLAGYFATDGSVSQDGTLSITSADRQNLEVVRDVCVRLGVLSHPITEAVRDGYTTGTIYKLNIARHSVREEFFLRAAHRERAREAGFDQARDQDDWTIESIEPDVSADDVFCAVVPDGHAFALEDNILTGNCGGGCVKAGIGTFVHLLRVLPDVFAQWEKNERGMQEFLGRDDISILTDRRGGVRVPLTLARLRERVEAGEKFPSANRFACGCFSPDDE